MDEEESQLSEGNDVDPHWANLVQEEEILKNLPSTVFNGYKVRFLKKDDYYNGFTELKKMDGANLLSNKAMKYSHEVKYSDTFDIEFNPNN